MYFLTACLIVVLLSAVMSFRRARSLPRTRQGRFAAIWPVLCAGACALVLIGFDRVQGPREFGPSATTYLLMLITSFFSGWFLGVIGGMDWTD